MVNGRIYEAHVYEKITIRDPRKRAARTALQEKMVSPGETGVSVSSGNGNTNTIGKAYIKGKKIFTFRDSLNLLPCSLDVLAKNLCPELGKKGDINHEEMNFESIKKTNVKYEVLEYLRQDIRLLAGVMLSAQEIYHRNFDVDITEWVTISSKALGIFRSKFLDDKKSQIYIPTMNVDNFVRKGYFGGRAEAYMPKGSNLFYYDVNSLYPYIMKEHDMPGGKPVWNIHSYTCYYSIYFLTPRVVE